MTSTRRNGMLSSCEPCRKSKLRCDHTTPICERCARRGQADICIYHPSPLSHKRSLDRAREPRVKRRLTERNCTSAPGLLRAYRLPPDTSSLGSHQDENIAKWSKKKGLFSSPGFLGLTSYWSVFSESETNRSMLMHRQRESSSTSTSDVNTIDPKQVQLGVQILALLDDIPLYEKILETRFEIWDGWVFGICLLREIFKFVKEMRVTALQDSRNKQFALLALSEKMFENSSSEININESTSLSQFCSDIAGRWETIGLLFQVVGVAALIIPNHNAVFQCEDKTVIDTKSLAILATEVGEICVGFCDHAGTVNDPLSWFLLQHTILLEHVYGDSDYRPWRKLGELSTIVFALGLHQTQPADQVPFFLSEIRKRIMVAAYAIDKELAVLLGRPPRIGWQYCDLQLPLDINYDEIIASEDVRNLAISKTDENGWNIEGSLAKGARARAALLTSILREKILALSLSPRQGNMTKRVRELCQECNNTRRELPPFLQWKPDNNIDSMRSDYDDEFLSSLHLEFLHADFLLHRILARETGTRSEGLIRTAREILTVVLTSMSRRTRTGGGVCNGFNLCYIGLPSAGILSIELLHRSQPQTKQTSSSFVPFPRSEIIQNLSIFASQLETMIPSHDGNYEIAQQGQRAICGVLDRVLSRDDVPPNPPVVVDGNTTESLADRMAIEDGTDFMTWLENIDWGQEPWLNFS